MFTHCRVGKTRHRKTARHTPQPRGPDDEPLCRYCHTVVRPPRRTFCSDACIHEWRIRTQASYARQCAKRRDKEVCQECGLDCTIIQSQLRTLYRTNRSEWKARCQSLDIPLHRGRGTVWDLDHHIPVAEGGGDCGLDNLRTLCLWCHRAVTALLIRRLAAKRAADKKSNNKE